MLSSIQQLTRLELWLCNVEPSVLAGRTQLQHLTLGCCNVESCSAAWVEQLLSYLQPLQQLTHLNLTYSLQGVEGDHPPAAAYTALTASSKLQHLNIHWCNACCRWVRGSTYSLLAGPCLTCGTLT
jgi:hypothetical protein